MKQLLALCLAAACALPAQAARPLGQAAVRSSNNNLPCFTISQADEARAGTPDFEAVTVSAGARILWRMSMPRTRTFPLAFSMCIPYGGRVPALPQTPAAALGAGRVYTVQLDTRASGNGRAPLRYQAQFCLAPRGAGVLAVRQIGAGEAPLAVGCRERPG